MSLWARLMRCSHDVGALKKSSRMDVFVTHSLSVESPIQRTLRLHCISLYDTKESKTNTNEISALELLGRCMEEIGKPQVIVYIR